MQKKIKIGKVLRSSKFSVLENLKIWDLFLLLSGEYWSCVILFVFAMTNF